MKWSFKKILIFCASYILCHIVIVYSYPTSSKLVDSLTAPVLGVLAGLLIGAVGVFLGSLGNLYAVLKSTTRPEGEHLSTLNDLLNKITLTGKEVKENVFFVLAVLAVTVVLPFIVVIDIPNVSWPFQISWLSKQIVSNTIVLWLTVLAFIAIFDCVGAMFLLHQHYESAVKEWLNKSK